MLHCVSGGKCIKPARCLRTSGALGWENLNPDYSVCMEIRRGTIPRKRETD